MEFKNMVKEYQKGDYVEDVYASYLSAYPEDGIQGGNYYELIGEAAAGYYKIDFINYVSSTENDTYPEDGVQDGYWYKQVDTEDGLYPAWNDHNILTGGVDYVLNINPENDYIIGPVGSASIEFKTIDKSLIVEDGKYYFYSNLANRANGLKLVGVFNITECEKQDKSCWKITAYDNLYFFEKVIDDWLFNTVQYPITLQSLYQSLCNYIGVEYVDKTLLNGDYELEDNFNGTNITGKMLLQYIAEMCAGYVYVTADGKIDIGTYTRKRINLDSVLYTKAKSQDFQTAPIDKVIAKKSEDDIGVISGSGEITYTIYNNPLFYVEDETTDLQDALDTIFDTVNSASYVPGEVDVQEDYGIDCGDIITVDDNLFYVMEKRMTSSGIQYSCFGNKVRENNTSLNAEIMALRGKSNELTRTLDETRSTLTDTAAGLQSQITQTASSITSYVNDEIAGVNSTITQTASSLTSYVDSQISGVNSTITQTANSITSYVNSEISGVNSTITQTANSLSSTITSQGQTITQIQQDLNGISLTYNSQNGTASITIGDVTVTNLVDGQYVSQVVAGIDLTGYVTFSALSTSGQTTINGDNITTGTINANRLNLTGSIAWSDLTSSCQSTIAAYAGSGVPSYIKSTYIDSTTIKSPTIYGAEIYAGTSADGYISMTSNGMNFISSVGGSLIGMGYYPGNYPYPYITLGQGINAYGTDKGMIKKYSNGLWIGDSDGISDTSEGQGTGIFINFTTGVIYKYINGTATAI